MATYNNAARKVHARSIVNEDKWFKTNSPDVCLCARPADAMDLLALPHPYAFFHEASKSQSKTFMAAVIKIAQRTHTHSRDEDALNDAINSNAALVVKHFNKVDHETRKYLRSREPQHVAEWQTALEGPTTAKSFLAIIARARHHDADSTTDYQTFKAQAEAGRYFVNSEERRFLPVDLN